MLSWSSENTPKIKVWTSQSDFIGKQQYCICVHTMIIGLDMDTVFLLNAKL